MQKEIVISADFSDPGSPILAGPTELNLQATKIRVQASENARLAAVKELGQKCRDALVIDHHFDGDNGWITTRTKFRRSPADNGAE
jgi:hypothetical protein